MSIYLCYDLKGIQSYIFSVPKLKYIIGGSALIDRFDHELTDTIRLPEGASLLFAGGGRGGFYALTHSDVNQIQDQLTEHAHRIGADIAFGRSTRYSEAAHCADRLFPYMPSGAELSGHPCPESGLLPVADGQQMHPTIQRRIFDRRDRVTRHYERMLLANVDIPSKWSSRELTFFRDVNAQEGEDGRAGALALGGRNRWAVIAMDGNDMGAQFREAHHHYDEASELFFSWLQETSRALDEATKSACSAGINEVIKCWDADGGGDHDRDQDQLTLPIRPLLVGGDDVIVLCHCDYALMFVEEVARTFNRSTRDAHEAWREACGRELWPATQGELTISAGILFSSVSLPLYSALEYAESLLASAKGKGRSVQQAGHPAPACVDWDHLTQGVIEHPAVRRQRDCWFYDEDIDARVELTQRPYTLSDLSDLMTLSERYQEIPHTLQHEITEAMRSAYWDREMWCMRVKKNHKELAEDLSDQEISGDAQATSSRWVHRRVEGSSGAAPQWVRSTDALDALEIIFESQRMQYETIRS